MENLTVVNNILKRAGFKKIRICYEQAIWNSSDDKIKNYYHVHIQHDDLPDLNIGVGDSSFNNLINKIITQIIPELEQKLLY